MPDPLLSLTSALFLAGMTALLVWPRRGLISRWRRSRHINERVLTEDALKHIHKWEMKGRRPTLESVAGAVEIPRDNAAALMTNMEALGLLTSEQGEIRLTPQGRNSALHIIRAHRLWERYLADQTGYTEAEWHERAERFEHALLPAEVDALSLRLGNPTYDPHGDPIPDAAGDFVYHDDRPLTTLGIDRPGRIVHVEDEPEAVYAQLVAEGIYPGQEVRVIELTPQRLRFWANGDEHVLAPMLAANISVAPIEVEVAAEVETSESPATLNVLKPGQRGTVVGISPRCRGPERRRMMDLGILPGTVITAEMVSPSGDPTAYRIRDALIALRAEQAQLINVQRAA